MKNTKFRKNNIKSKDAFVQYPRSRAGLGFSNYRENKIIYEINDFEKEM